MKCAYLETSKSNCNTCLAETTQKKSSPSLQHTQKCLKVNFDCCERASLVQCWQLLMTPFLVAEAADLFLSLSEKGRSEELSLKKKFCSIGQDAAKTVERS